MDSIAAGRVPDAIVDELTNSLLPHRLEVPDVTYLMVGAGVATAQAAVEDLPGVHVSHDNCVHQSVLCGDPNGLAVAAERLRADGVLCQDLPIRSGFHSPAFVDYLEPFRQTCRPHRVPPPAMCRCGRPPRWRPYPEDAEGVRALSLRHLVEPVRFRELAEALYEQAGARFFVQMGFGSVKAFVDDTLHDRTVATVTAGSPKRGALAQLLRAAVGLWAEGVEVDFSVLAPADGTRCRCPPTASDWARRWSTSPTVPSSPCRRPRLRRGCSPAWIPTSCWAGTTARWWWRTSR